MAATAMDPRQDWVTIFMGEPWRVALMEGELESAGIRTLIPDRIVKMIDPFITGANPLEFRVQVPSSQHAAAVEFLAEAERRRQAAVPLDAEEAWLRSKAIDARRLSWAALFPITALLVPWLAFHYFSGLRGHPQKPAGHGFAVFATGYALVSLFVLGLYLVEILQDAGSGR